MFFLFQFIFHAFIYLFFLTFFFYLITHIWVLNENCFVAFLYSQLVRFVHGTKISGCCLCWYCDMSLEKRNPNVLLHTLSIIVLIFGFRYVYVHRTYAYWLCNEDVKFIRKRNYANRKKKNRPGNNMNEHIIMHRLRLCARMSSKRKPRET